MMQLIVIANGADAQCRPQDVDRITSKINYGDQPQTIYWANIHFGCQVYAACPAMSCPIPPFRRSTRVLQPCPCMHAGLTTHSWVSKAAAQQVINQPLGTQSL